MRYQHITGFLFGTVIEIILFCIWTHFIVYLPLPLLAIYILGVGLVIEIKNN